MLDSPDALSTWLKSTAAEFEARIDELDGLDAAIGDGDHGTNMARGMATASTIVPSPDTTTRQYLNQVGMALVSSGGASGPLFGTFFLRVGQLWQSPHSVSSIWQALKAGRDGIASRGRAKVGDKTMLDALCPAVDVLEHAAMERDEEPSASLTRAAAAAWAGAEATRDMVARRGRAAHYGERSVGHIDPGAVSMAMILDNASRIL